ncbi:MAG TPA: histidine kinase dimerization/phospho-acceptor domain-containing protein [Pyrinomonadaceae bacterium]|nr:histidine kinase dimerization/phospho-acceptor domain-containing protein [Pyrinomonadaceae bacterium]
MLELKCTPDAQWARSTGSLRHTFRKQLTIAFSLQFSGDITASMTEHEDQIAQYRLKLEETAALVARIRHEINNPLTGVLGQAQLLLREDLSERSRKRVQTIEDLALRLRDVVAQLREVQKPGGDSEGEQANS